MAHRTVLTERQRSALLDLPTNETAMLRYYTLADDDLEIIRARRRPHNRFGFALQLCALRHPGRLLAPGEVIPLEVTRFLAAQLGLKADDLAGYASREETRHEHLAEPAHRHHNLLEHQAPRSGCRRRPPQWIGLLIRPAGAHLPTRMGPHPAHRRIQMAQKVIKPP